MLTIKIAAGVIAINHNSLHGAVSIKVLLLPAIYGGESLGILADNAKSDILENKDHGGYTVGKYYVYKKGGTAPKKGHKTYEDAKAEINRIRTAVVNERCKDFVIFKCVGINYAEVEYKEIKGE